jgi:two-component system OmpR family sensor kinase
MRSLKVRFALLLGGTAIVVVLAAAAALAAIGAAERTVDRTLEAQRRLELLAELSGRLTQFGLAAVETVGNPDNQPEAMAIARDNADRALTTVDEALATSFPPSDDPADRMQYAARTRPMAQLRAARAVLDRQVALIGRQTDPERRQDAIKGALNGFGAMTGQPLSFLIEVERRSSRSSIAESPVRRSHASRRCVGRRAPSAAAPWTRGCPWQPATSSAC